MKKLALSVLNPTSYLICMGIKTVENRTWKTDYRGRIYIHSSGGHDYYSLLDYEYPAKVGKKIDEFQVDIDSLLDEACIDDDDEFPTVIEKLKKIGKYEQYAEVLNYSEKFETYRNALKKFYGYDVYKEDIDDAFEEKCINAMKKKGCFHVNFAIIGHVDLVDIVQDSDSMWAEKGCYHWILKNPVLYKNPVVNVKGRMRLFDVSHVDMPDD